MNGGWSGDGLEVVGHIHGNFYCFNHELSFLMSFVIFLIPVALEKPLESHSPCAAPLQLLLGS